MRRHIFWFLVVCAAVFFIAISVSVVGAIVTHVYAAEANQHAVREVTEFHQKNLRTYALKAAEKVNNLSKELGRLSAYLEQELQETDYGGVEEELNAKEERIQSAIHLINTLKSVNDTALSDWQGVIGEEINEQRERAGQREETLRQVVERLAALEAIQREEVPNSPDISLAPLQEQLENLRRDVRTLAGELGAPFWGATPRHHRSQHIVETICPSCGNQLDFRQKPRQGSRKAITCKKCETELISEYSDAIGFTLRLRRELPESIVCPSCGTEAVVPLDEWSNATTTTVCANCSNVIRLSRSSEGVRFSLMPAQLPKHKATEEIIQQVKAALPAQPWPKGIHNTVGEQLGLAPQVVRKAIQQLILKGDFMDQYDGQIMTTAEKIKLVRTIGADL